MQYATRFPFHPFFADRTIVGLFVSLVAVTALAAGAPAAYAHDGKRSMAPVLKKVTPAVVNISVTATRTMARNPLFDDPFFRRFFDVPEGRQPRQRQSQSVGSGVIIDAGNGYIVTNHHVIDGADEVAVTLQDRRRFDADVVGSDAATDLALLKIEADDLTAVTLGDARALEVGDFVAAIGNPFGLGQTVTSGIVSALGRSGLIPQGYEDFIQTDASINPGNSGGALIDIDGRLIGINTAIIAPAGGNVGIGFAVPVDIVSGVMDQLLESGEVKRGQLGVLIQDVTPDLAEALELAAPEGALVSQVVEGSAAEEAGIEVGDVVVALDGEPIVDSSDLRNRIGLMRVGRELELRVLRDGRNLRLKAKVGAASNQGPGTSPTIERLEGAEFRPIDQNHPRYGEVEGVAVATVERGSVAWRVGLRAGDIILSVNRRPVNTVDRFTELMNARSGTLALHIQRGNGRLFLVVQ